MGMMKRQCHLNQRKVKISLGGGVILSSELQTKSVKKDVSQQVCYPVTLQERTLPVTGQMLAFGIQATPLNHLNTQILLNLIIVLKRAGKSFNTEVHNRKEYRNPDFLVHAVSYQGIYQIRSCFSKASTQK